MLSGNGPGKAVMLSSHEDGIGHANVHADAPVVKERYAVSRLCRHQLSKTFAFPTAPMECELMVDITNGTPMLATALAMASSPSLCKQDALHTHTFAKRADEA
jgi:hypothetical protein